MLLANNSLKIWLWRSMHRDPACYSFHSEKISQLLMGGISVYQGKIEEKEWIHFKKHYSRET